MIFDASSFPLPLTLESDLCVIGSGAGGATAATVAAEGGMKVIMLEAGEFLTPSDMSQREEEMMPRLFREAGARTTADRRIKIIQGKGVGGSTLHNQNLCKRIPPEILEDWSRNRQLAKLSTEDWDALYGEIEKMLEVTQIDRGLWNRHNLLLEKACQELGWRGGPLFHNRTGCIGSGFCELGCAYDAKNNAFKVLVPRAIRAGAQILFRCQAIRLLHEADGVTGVQAVALEPRTNRVLGQILIRAPRVCVSASATGTAAILRRSRLSDPPGSVGENLHIHPAVIVAGDFDQPVRAWEGIPQTYECTQFLEFGAKAEHEIWIVPAFAHPLGTSVMLPGHGRSHRDLMERYEHLAVLTAMLHDSTVGRVEPAGDLGLRIGYRLSPEERGELVFGLRACAKLLFAAGARRVIVPGPNLRILRKPDEIEDLRKLSTSSEPLGMTAVHPMSTVPMGDDPQTAAVGSDGKHHRLEGLWIADGSLFPSSIGGPPQLSIYALGLHVGRALLAHG